jgi:hypothetical protein
MENSKFHSEYLREDRFAIYHELDDYLPTIEVKLPSVEDFYGMPWDEAIKRIDGYGLDPKDQHFENYRKKGFYTFPERLANLSDHVRRKLEKKPQEMIYPHELFDELESDPIEYLDEINWIRKQQDRGENGTFLFIKGKPTWITGTHYKLLCCWPIDNEERRDGLAFYRDVDRRIYIFLLWAHTTKSAFFKYILTFRNPRTGEVDFRWFNTKSGASAWAATEGVDYVLADWNQNVEMPYRTCFGVAVPKRRRVGMTSHGSFFGVDMTCRTGNGQMAIQALTEQTATDDVYTRNILQRWNEMWFIWKPTHSRHTASSMSFMPDYRSSLPHEIRPHGGRIVPRSSKNKAFDGNRLAFYFNDESGKKERGDIIHEWSDTIKNTLAYGLKIHGFSLYASTFGEYTKGGGKEYLELCRRSLPTQRDDNGHTGTGMYTLFISAADGYDHSVDIYGYGHINDPDEPYQKPNGDWETRGAMSMLMATRRGLEQSKDWKGLNNEIRSNPIQFSEAGAKAMRGDSISNNVAAIREQISELKYGNSQARRVRFRWSDGRSLKDRPHRNGITVVMEDDPNGDWEISLNLPPEMRSRMHYDSSTESWGPDPQTIGKFLSGIDPFKHEARDLATSSKKPSKAALALKYRHDPVVDGEDKLPSEWQSCRYVCTYLKRADTQDESCEEMLLPCVYFGAMALIEKQVDVVIQTWRRWKFDGYVMHLINQMTGELDKAPGIHTSVATHEKGIGLINSHLKYHIKREQHVEQLEQILDTEDFSDITHNDLVAATEICEIACQNQYADVMKSVREMTLPENEFTLRLF